jgi:hypothetical protein
MPLRTILGHFVDTNGSPIGGGTVRARLSVFTAINGEIIALPVTDVTAATDGSGFVSLAVIVPETGTARYELTTPKGSFTANLAAGPDTTFAALYAAGGGAAVSQDAITTALDAHVAQSDPHPQYLTTAEGDIRYILAGEDLEVAISSIAGLQAALDALAPAADLAAEAAARVAGDSALDARVDALELAPPPHAHSAADLPSASTSAAGVVELATDGEASSGLAVQANDGRLANARTPTGGAGGVLSGSYPNPGFAVDMATQGELDAEATARAAADAALDGRLDALEAIDYATQVELDAEASARAAADAALDGRVDALEAAGGGVTDHGALTGLGDDDHPQYFNQARGDARYYTETESDALFTAHTSASDPHPGYQQESEKGVASGYASLDSGGIHPGAEMGTGFGAIPAGKEAFAFVNALRQWIVRDMLRLPEQTTRPTATADQAVLYGYDLNGFTTVEAVDPSGFVYRIGGDLVRIVRNTTGATIAKGKVVYISGSFAGGGVVPTVALARANSATTLPAVGLAGMEILNNSYGIVVTEGRVDNIDTLTSGAVDGQRVLVSAATAGEFTATVPSLPNHTQRLGIVIKAHATQGAILVDPQAVITGAQGSVVNTFSVGDNTAGNKALRFLAASTLDLQANPTAPRTVTVPDASGTVAFAPVVNTYTASTTLAIPTSGHTRMRARLFGAGGGGGSGRRGATGAIRGGGGGGGSGAVTEVEYSIADLLALGSTLTITVGAGGGGSGARSSNDTDGGSGTSGGTSSLAISGTTIAAAAGGSGGSGGTSAAGGSAGNGGSAGATAGGANGGAGSNGSAAGSNGSSGGSIPGAGAGGGGISAANAVTAGGAGGSGGRAWTSAGSTATGGTAGDTTPSAGGAGSSSFVGGAPGNGGGGGGAHASSAGGAGGNGSRGGGGGGGAGSTNGANSGAGGIGGDGYIELVFI